MTLGVDEPDARGRTGLHLTGLDLAGNPDVQVRAVTLLASNWYILRTTELDFRLPNGTGALELGAKAISGLRRDASADGRLGRRFTP
jgi:hypothetical protein